MTAKTAMTLTETATTLPRGPQREGLYHPSNEHDACGVAFVADIYGRQTHDIVEKGIQALVNLDHRGAAGAEKTTGDGAGILIQVPDAYYRAELSKEGVILPPAGTYATGIAFLPQSRMATLDAIRAIEDICAEEGIEILAWRDVPINADGLGQMARQAMPVLRQLFVTAKNYEGRQLSDIDLDRKMFFLRKRCERELGEQGAGEGSGGDTVYFPSLSSRTIVYKGMLTTPQLKDFYLDLQQKEVTSALAIVHSRFSTNTFPSWPLAHPYRYVAHNGEINTVRGNENWMRARESLIRSGKLGNIDRALPVCDPNGSDTARFDEALELLHLGGRSLPHAVMMMVPQAWEHDDNLSPQVRAFYEYHACLMEPWDGPAAICFTDGQVIGATLDRNGLRPGRIWVTDEGLVVMASEAGVLDIPPEQIVQRTRVQPGRMFLVDMKAGRIIEDKEIKSTLAATGPYEEWIKEGLVDITDLPRERYQYMPHARAVLRQRVFGITEEDVDLIIRPMALTGAEGLGSMGSDTPIAALSNRPRMLFDFFSQRFAQVTNPPLDSLREKSITSMNTLLGAETNILEPTADAARRIRLEHPILDNHDFVTLCQAGKNEEYSEFRAEVISGLYPVARGGRGLRNAIRRVRREVSEAIDRGARLIVLSDRESNERSAIKQVASGRFGVTSHYLSNCTDIQIKMAQGAKPGEGGQLPPNKVYPWIAEVRITTPGVGLISPPPHHDIYSIEDLAQLIYDLKNANPRARIHVKLVSEQGVGTVAAGVSKAHADVVLISGHDGGTGASPLTSLKHAGGPWELGLAETQQTLMLNGLRDRIRVQCDGQLKTGRDVVVAMLLGAEEFGFATAPLVVEGCVMMRVCHLDTCPVGIATQNPKLRSKFTGRAEHVVNFFTFIAQQVREYLAELGFRTIDEAVGHAECLRPRKDLDNLPRVAKLDLERILHVAESPFFADQDSYCTKAQDHGLEGALDERLIDEAQPALRTARANGLAPTPVSLHHAISNVNRSVGTRLGYEVTKVAGKQGLADDSIVVNLLGSAGNSLGAFLPAGVTIKLEGDANDFVGKGLCGGKIVVRPSRSAPPTADVATDTIAGNVIGFGATSGEIFVRGTVGERFCVRNSGATAVVEGIGNHGCEYMTGGRVVVAGPVGHNFGAGMSGGIAYLLDNEVTRANINTELVDIVPLDDEDISWLEATLSKHRKLTGSKTRFPATQFIKIMPRDYARILDVVAKAKDNDADINEAIMEAVSNG